MAGVNKVILVGNLGADPEMRYTADGTAVCNFRIATTEKYKDRQGNMQERTEWFKIVCSGASWRRSAASTSLKASRFTSKARSVTKAWEKDGVKQYSYKIVADTMQMLGGPGQGNRAQEPEPGFGPPEGGVPEDDIPF